MAKITIRIITKDPDLNKYGLFIKPTRLDEKKIDNLRISEKDQVLTATIDNLSNDKYIVKCTFSPSAEEAVQTKTLEVVITNDEEHQVTFNFDGSLTRAVLVERVDVHSDEPVEVTLKQPVEVKLTPSTGEHTPDQLFWKLINKPLIDFDDYKKCIDFVLGFSPIKSCNDLDKDDGFGKGSNGSNHFFEKNKKRLPFHRTEIYSVLKYATERYVALKTKVDNYFEEIDVNGNSTMLTTLPYYADILKRIDEYFSFTNDGNVKVERDDDPFLVELIWSYWHEEGMLEQTMIAIARRFQNIRNGYNDPLANFELDPLRPLNNILWGYIEDVQHRLTVVRRNYEYEHLYGLNLAGTQIAGFNPADRRSKFLQSFHRLLHEATEYFVQADNTIIRPDGFKLLNALRDTHRILSEGAHNQFGDLPTVARIEMLIEQWILSRPEIREFLGSRIMVPYEEPWMDRVDSMKTLQGWDSTSITFYRDLAVYGERIILGIRYGNWTAIIKRDNATNWADAFRDAIQRYIHSYFNVTGVDLAAQNVNINPEEKFLLPGMLIRQKVTRERNLQRRY